jgi:hypothetical protein
MAIERKRAPGLGAGLSDLTPQQLRELAGVFWNARPAPGPAGAILSAAWCVVDEALERSEDHQFQRFMSAATRTGI